MGFYWMNKGEEDVIEIYLKNSTQHAQLYIGLFTAPFESSWNETKLYDDLTEVMEESGGYTRQIILPSDWVRTGSIAEQTYVQFDFSSDVIVLGYFIIDTSTGTGIVLAVEYFTSPKSMLIGEYLKIKAKIEVK